MGNVTARKAGMLLIMCGVCQIAESRANSLAFRAPERFEPEIRVFDAADKRARPPSGAIVFLGSSSIKGWHSTLAADFAPLTVIPRGFGGSHMNDALCYADRIVIPYKPRAVVLYEGDNDIADGLAPEAVLERFRALVARVRAALPAVRFYVLSVKPSISRWALWPKMQETNHLLAAECARDERLTYVDVAHGMFDGQGTLRENLFQEDRLHTTRAGYEIWREALRPVLLKGELDSEPRGTGKSKQGGES